MEKVILCPHCLSRVEEGKQQCPFCEKALVNTNPPGALEYASLLADRYTVGRHIATDGEGILYEAVENHGGVRVILKEYLPVTLSEGRSENGEIQPKEGSEVLFKTTRMDFADLYRSVMRITPATGLMTVLDVFEEHNTVYAVMEQLSGETLSQRLARDKRNLPPEEARSLLQPVMEGVAAMHKVGLVHRGVCTANIIITSGGAPRLCGYATIGLRTGGSPLKEQLYEGYTAPEQYSAAEFEGKYTDVYGLAAVFFRLVTGQRPDSAAQRKVNDSLMEASRIEPNVPGYISQVLDTALTLEPSQRIQNVPELMGALASPAAAENLAKQHSTAKGEENNQKKDDNTISTKTLFTGSLIVIVILFLLLIYAFLRQEPAEKESAESQPPTVSVQPIQIKEIPNVVGMSFRQLENDTEYADYTFTISDQQYSSDFGSGVIIKQEPQAGNTTMDEVPHIEVVVSKGPEMVEMPNIFGWPKEAAEQELQANHIKASFYMTENNGDYASNSVVNTDVAAGEFIDVNKTTVSVYIAKERMVYVPESENAE